MTDCHVKLDILVDAQESFSNSHHKIAFDYDEDTVSLVEEPTLATSEVSLSDNSDSSAGNASIAFEYYCYEIKADAPRFEYHGPKIKIPKQELPMSICTADKIGNIRSQRLFRVPFDSGSNVSMIKRSVVLRGIITKLLGDIKLVRTLAGHLKMHEVVTMQDLRLPKFDGNKCINQQKVLVFDNDNVKYNIILSTNFLSKTGIKLNYSEGNMEWFDCSIPLCPPGGLDSKEFDAKEDMFHIQVEDKLFGEDWLKCFTTEIINAKYEKTDIVEVIKRLTHLNAHQKQTCFECYMRTTTCLMELLAFIHIKSTH